VEVPITRYVRSGEFAIAYQVHGSGDHDIVLSGGPFSNVHTVWQLPEAARLFDRLGRFARVIRYDRRDSGLSDPVKDDLTLEAHAQDALAVIDAVQARRPVLFGAFDGCRSQALLAATHPQRVGGLIGLLPSARATMAMTPEFAASVTAALASLDDYPGPLALASAPQWAHDPVRSRRLISYFQTCSTPRQTERILRMAFTSDISDALPLVQAPTLVLFPRDSELLPAEAVRDFAERIPGAHYREIAGDATFIYALDVDLLGDIIEEFVTGSPPARATNRILATVLFTDLVDSTKRAAAEGDRAWADTLDRHFAATRAAVDEHGGETVKTTGDGILALFTGPAQAVRCAGRINSDADALDLRLRSGIHTGEVERSSDDVAGLAVHLAARIMGHATDGEILVSRTVKDLVIGSELTFTDRGEHELKGIPDRWLVYAVNT